MHDRYVNGLVGGFTKDNLVNIHFYHERLPIPKKTFYPYNEEGVTSQIGRSEYGGDAVRILQASLLLDVDMARDFRDWLNDLLKELEDEEGTNDSET